MIGTVYIAKGIGIILVVIGHYFPHDSPVYWVTLRQILYKFHMPLFFFLSGYLFHGLESNSYLKHIVKKSQRLLIPFASIAVLFFLIKYVPGLYLQLEHPVTLKSLLNIFINPLNSYMPLLWFVYSLYLIFVLYPALEYVFRSKFLVFVVSVLAVLLPAPEWLCLDKVFKNLPYFALGALLGVRYDLDSSIDRKILISLIIAAIVAFAYFFGALPSDHTLYQSHFVKYRELILGITGIIGCTLLSMWINTHGKNLASVWLQTVGYYSMSIYLFHTLFESGTRVLLYQVLKVGGILFEVKAIAAIIAGIIFPLALEKYVLRKQFLARRLLLGLG